MWVMWSGVLPQQAPMAEIPAFRSRWAWAERTSGVPSYSNLSPFQTGIPAFALEITGTLPQVDRMAATAASVSALAFGAEGRVVYHSPSITRC